MGGLEQGDDFGLALDADHQLGNQPVEAGVGAEGQGGQRIVEAPFAGDEALDGVEERNRQAHAVSRVLSRAAGGPPDVGWPVSGRVRVPANRR
ncbi:hypothetical protein D9M73_298960 [compost metagenome]